MRRVLVAVVLVASASLVWIARPPAPPSLEDEPFEPAPPTAVVCPLVGDRSSQGSLMIGSIIASPARITSVAGGRLLADVTATVDGAGGAAVSFDALTAAGTVGALVELPSADAAAAVAATGSNGVVASGCTPPPRSAVIMAGGSTAGGTELDLVLVNPYAIDAVVAVTSSSEAGIDSASELESVIVPARSVVVRDLATLLPLRTRLAMTVAVERGLAHAFLVERVEGDRMILEGAAPADSWLLPVPAPRDAVRLIIATTAPVTVDVRVDAWTADGFVEGVYSGEIGAGAHIEIPLIDLEVEPEMVEVVSDAPVVAAMLVEGEGIRAGTPGVPAAAAEWILPGAGTGDVTAWIGNPGDLDADLVLQPLRPGASARAVTIPAGSVASVALEPAGGGYLVRSSTEVAIIWSRAGESGLGLARGSVLDE